ncbi:hypothetical protein Q1695_000326 [Nippostrongylus brasiliensis]|nr:hypothetical protein Q1695_000326 [Nippostrongylus brasiliensis]
MGNFLRRRKKVVTEELESLSHQMKVFREDIEKTSDAKRMILWYLTLSAFFFSSSFVAYSWITFVRKEHKVLFSLLSFIAGLIVLWLGRKLANAFYNWRLNRKRLALDNLVARKKSLLETVKETETFKVAKEILDKYDQESPKSVSQPSSPAPEKRAPVSPFGAGPPLTPNIEGKVPIPSSAPTGPVVKKLFTRSTDSIAGKEGEFLKPPMLPPHLNPVRPFQREGLTVVDRMVDYFFGDGPGQRMALICSSCHGHNGMALPAEFDYLAFVCYLCGHFNSARKFRPVRPPSTSGDNHSKGKRNNSLTVPLREQERREKLEDSFDDVSDSKLPTLSG